MRGGFIATAAFLLVAPGSIQAVTINLQEGVSPTAGYGHLGQDIRSNAASNTGADTLVGAQPGGVGNIRTVLGFDLSAIPAGSQITAVSLLMTVNNTGSGSPAGLGTIEVHEVVPNNTAVNNMVENQVSWAAWQTGSNWTTPGGDFGPTLTSGSVVDTGTIGTFTNGEQASFASTAAFVTAAQNALNAGLPLELILLSPTAEAAAGSNFARFGSDGATTAGNRPLLSIEYVPEPGASALLLVAAGAFLRRRRERN